MINNINHERGVHFELISIVCEQSYRTDVSQRNSTFIVVKGIQLPSPRDTIATNLYTPTLTVELSN